MEDRKLQSPQREPSPDFELALVEEKDEQYNSPAARAARFRMLWRAGSGEFLATVLFWFSVVCMSHNLDTVPSVPKPVAMAVGLGFLGVSTVYSFADISGAHFNPAVTVATWFAGRLSNRKTVLYVLCQLLGAIVANALSAAVFEDGMGVVNDFIEGMPPHNVNLGRVFLMEFMLTFTLIFVIFHVAFENSFDKKKGIQKLSGFSHGQKLTLYNATPQSKTGFAPLAIGFTIGFLSLMGGATSGGAFNPLRVWGPAVLTGKFGYQWVYWFGDLLGAISAQYVSRLFFYVAERSQPPAGHTHARSSVKNPFNFSSIVPGKKAADKAPTTSAALVGSATQAAVSVAVPMDSTSSSTSASSSTYGVKTTAAAGSQNP